MSTAKLYSTDLHWNADLLAWVLDVWEKPNAFTRVIYMARHVFDNVSVPTDDEVAHATRAAINKLTINNN